MNSLVDFALRNGGTEVQLEMPYRYKSTLGLSGANPSIFEYRGETYVNTRILNYYKFFSNNNFNFLEDNCGLSVASGSRYCKSDNVIVNQKTGEEFYLKFPFYFNAEYNGLEDGKFVIWNDKLYVYGTRCDVVKDKSIITIYELNDKFEIVKVINTNNGGISKVEKNWMAVPDKPFYFLYEPKKPVVIKINEDNGSFETVEVKRGNEVCQEQLRGNATMCRVDENRYIAIVHNSYEGGRKYRFKFVFYDNEFNAISSSDWFIFKNEMCEFCCGMKLTDGLLHISYSMFDCCSYVLSLPFDKIEEFCSKTIESNYPTMFDSNYFFNLAISCEKKFSTSIPIFNYVVCTTNPFEPIHYESAVRMLTYYIRFKSVVEEHIKELKELAMKYIMIFQDRCECYYILSGLYKFEGDFEMYREMKRLGDERKNSMMPYFGYYLNPHYL